jgi:hypothetical protein
MIKPKIVVVVPPGLTSLVSQLSQLAQSSTLAYKTSYLTNHAFFNTTCTDPPKDATPD